MTMLFDPPSMSFLTDRDTLHLSALRELNAATATLVRDDVRLRFTQELKNIDVHCEALEFLDSSGLGALISMQKLVAQRGGMLRLLHPRPSIMQVLELTRLHRLFDIVQA